METPRRHSLDSDFSATFLQPSSFYSLLRMRPPFMLARCLSYGRNFLQKRQVFHPTSTEAVALSCPGSIPGSTSRSGASNWRFLSLRIEGLVARLQHGSKKRTKPRGTARISPLSASLFLMNEDGSYTLLESHRIMVPLLQRDCDIESEAAVEVDFQLDFGNLSWHSHRCILVLHLYERCLATKLAGFRSRGAAIIQPSALCLQRVLEAPSRHLHQLTVAPSSKRVIRGSEESESDIVPVVPHKMRAVMPGLTQTFGSAAKRRCIRGKIDPVSRATTAGECEYPVPLHCGEIAVFGCDNGLHGTACDDTGSISTSAPTSSAFRSASPRCLVPSEYLLKLVHNKSLLGRAACTPGDGDANTDRSNVTHHHDVSYHVHFGVSWSGDQRSPYAGRAKNLAVRTTSLLRGTLFDNRGSNVYIC